MTTPVSLGDAFSMATLTIDSAPADRATSSVIVASAAAGGEVPENLYRTTAFYRDSSGRAQLSLKLRLSFADEGAAREVLRSGCVVPAPSVVDGEGDREASGEDGREDEEGGEEGSGGAHTSESTLRFECKSVSNSGELSPLLAVEGVTVLSTKIDLSVPAIVFDVEVSVRAPLEQGVPILPGSPPSSHAQPGGRPSAILEEVDDDEESAPRNPRSPSSPWQRDSLLQWEKDAGATSARLEVRAVLSQPVTDPDDNEGGNLQPQYGRDPFSLGLLALELGAGTRPQKPAASRSAAHTRYATSLLYTDTAVLYLRLVSALTLKVREVGGARAAMGATLLSLTVAHGNIHDEPVTITNIALHPGHSRLWPPQPPNAQAATPPMRHGSRYNTGPTSTQAKGGGDGRSVLPRPGGGGPAYIHPQQHQAMALQRSYLARRSSPGNADDDDSAVVTATSTTSATTGLPSRVTLHQQRGAIAGVGTGNGAPGRSGNVVPSAGTALATAGTVPRPSHMIGKGSTVRGVGIAGDALSPGWQSMQGGEFSVIDMSNTVRWGFAMERPRSCRSCFAHMRPSQPSYRSTQGRT